MKRLLKRIVVAILSWQLKLLRKRHSFKVIGVVGGVGKTSTKLAIAQLLDTAMRVKYEALRPGYQESNYNHLVSVPMVFFGHGMPSLLNPLAWTKLFVSNMRQIAGDYPYDVVVVELGTNKPGEIVAFSTYLQLDYAVLTAIVPEHMEYFGTMEGVAKEELSVVAYSDKLIYNADLVAAKYRDPLKNGISYGIKQHTEYQLAASADPRGVYTCELNHETREPLRFRHEVVSETQLYSVIAAVIMGKEFGLTDAQLVEGIAAITPVSGRLRRLAGRDGSLIIDDTYNALPDALRAGLEVLYGLEAPQKIAILGNMNELGELSKEAHTKIGELCDPSQLDLVVTIGPDANDYLAPAAAANGCTVKTFTNPYDAGEYVKPRVKPHAVIYAKGSQNKVFAEEALKPLLADQKDVAKLVRQSEYWLKRKAKNFGREA